MIRSRPAAILITSLLLIAFSLGTVLTKLTFDTISPSTFVYTSMILAITSLNLFTFVLKRESIPKEIMTRRVWTYILQMAFFNFVMGTLSLFALKYMSASTNAYLTNFVGFITMAMSAIILKEVPGIWQIAGAIIAFSGLRVFFPETPQRSELLGIGLIFISILGIAYTNNIARKLAIETDNKISNNIISTLALTIGGSVTVVIFMLIDGFPPVVPSLANWLVILYAGIVTRGFGSVIWNLILRTLRSYEASILGASTIIWTSILAYLILQEIPSFNQVIGIAMMLLGILLVQMRGGSLRTLFRKKIPNY